MHGNVGDWLVIKGAKLDDPYRRGEIVELLHEDGAPPYYVHWLDNGRTTLVFPGPDSHVEHRAAEPVS
jgi:Domain of unknown function (DUF1918)